MPIIVPALINGAHYEWPDIVLNIFGTQFTGCTKLNYKEKDDMKNVMAASRYPNGRIYGQIESSGSISLLMKEIEAIQAVAPNNRIQDIPEFDIMVSYVDSRKATVTHKLIGCRFMNNGRESSAGGDAIMEDIELIIAKIQWA